jgi:transcriptional regulator with XRE-family HTH domain
MQNRIRELRERAGLSQEQVAERMGTIRGQVSKLESGKARLNDVWIARLSSALGCSPAELIADVDVRQIPVIGDVPGGDLVEAIQRPADIFIQFNSGKPNLFALRVRGNSMSRIAADGAYVIVDRDDRDPARLVNQPVIVCMECGGVHECSFKMYRRNPDRFEPLSIEAGYDTIFPHDRAWQILGRVVGMVGYLGDEALLIERGIKNDAI